MNKQTIPIETLRPLMIRPRAYNNLVRISHEMEVELPLVIERLIDSYYLTTNRIRPSQKKHYKEKFAVNTAKKILANQ